MMFLNQNDLGTLSMTLSKLSSFSFSVFSKPGEKKNDDGNDSSKFTFWRRCNDLSSKSTFPKHPESGTASYNQRQYFFFKNKYKFSFFSFRIYFFFPGWSGKCYVGTRNVKSIASGLIGASRKNFAVFSTVGGVQRSPLVAFFLLIWRVFFTQVLNFYTNFLKTAARAFLNPTF